MGGNVYIGEEERRRKREDVGKKKEKGTYGGGQAIEREENVGLGSVDGCDV